MQKTDEWLSEAIRIENSLSGSHPVLQACVRAIRNLQKYLPLLQKLGSPFVKVGCWKEIFAGEAANGRGVGWGVGTGSRFACPGGVGWGGIGWPGCLGPRGVWLFPLRGAAQAALWGAVWGGGLAEADGGGGQLMPAASLFQRWAPSAP